MFSRAPTLAVLVATILVVSGSYYFTTISSSSDTVTITVTNGTPQNGGADIFEPRNFTVKDNQQVTIVFVNTDDGPQELVILQFNVTTGIVQGGQSTRVALTPNRVGTFEYFEPADVCAYKAGPAACTGLQETSGNMTVLAP